MWENIGTVIVGAAFVLNLLGTVVGVTWKLSRVETSIKDALKVERREIDEAIDRVRQEAGEMGHALREKIREVELHGRDTFMRRDSFYESQKAQSADIKTLIDQVQARLERMEAKIDSKT